MATTSPHRNGSTDAEAVERLDDAFRSLADERQRGLCRYLRADDRDAVPLDDLVDVLVDGTEESTATQEARTEATVDLLQCRLPALERAGVVDYCPAERSVEYCGGTLVETLLSAADACVGRGSALDRDEPDDAAESGDVEDGNVEDGDVENDAIDRSAERDRIVLDLLDEHASMTLADLADEVAERDHGVSVADVDPETVLDIYLDLAATHVPRLAEDYLVRYDEERDVVSLVGHGPDVTVDLSVERTADGAEAAEVDPQGSAPGSNGGVTVALSGETVDLLSRVAQTERSADGPVSYDDRIRAALSELDG